MALSRYVVLNPVRAKGMVRKIENWPWSSYLAMIGAVTPPAWLTTDWIVSQFGKQKYRRFVMQGIRDKRDIWSDLKGQIYLGDDAFVSTMQKKIGKGKDDWNIPQKQKRPVPPSLAEIVRQKTGRNAAIITAYATGAYSQREISEHFELHPSTVGVIVRRHKTS